MLSKPQKQYEINELIKEILQKNIFSDKESVDIKKLVGGYCDRLMSIFDEGDFRPHYFEVSQFLLKMTDSQYQRTSSVKLLIRNIQDCLASGFLEKNKLEIHDDNSNTGLNKYYDDTNFQYDVDMFFAALLHEIIIFELRVSNQKLLNNQVSANMIQERIRDTAQDFKEKSDDLEANFSSLKSEFKETSLKIEDNHKNSQETYLKVKEALSNVEASRESVEKAVEESKGVLPNLLTIMGIFVAIIIAIVAVYLSLVLDSVSVSSVISLANSIPKRIMLIVFLCAFVFNLLFAFIYWISKLANKSIAATCSGCKNSECKVGKCNFVKRTWKRYWNFFVVNIFFLLIIAICCLACWSNDLNQATLKETQEPVTESTYTIDDYSFNGTVEIQENKTE